METILKSREWIKWLSKVDEDWAEETRGGGCKHCASKLHCGNFPRKVRDVPDWDERISFDCSRCRRRTTPVSVRFLGRRVYAGIIVILLAAMMHGLNKSRVEALRQELGIAVRTLKRWREWWLGEFVKSSFWKGVRGLFTPVLKEAEMPLSLVNGFDAKSREGLVKLLRFISPITIGGLPGGQDM